MGRTYCNSKKGSVKNRPRGHISGAKLTFPVKKRWVTIPVEARMVRVLVAEPTDEKHWAKGLGGTRRLAIECTIRAGGQAPEILYLDNEDTETLWKVTAGEGHPKYGIRQLPVQEVVPDDTIATFYRMEYVEQGVWRIVGGAA